MEQDTDCHRHRDQAAHNSQHVRHVEFVYAVPGRIQGTGCRPDRTGCSPMNRSSAKVQRPHALHKNVLRAARQGGSDAGARIPAACTRWKRQLSPAGEAEAKLFRARSSRTVLRTFWITFGNSRLESGAPREEPTPRPGGEARTPIAHRTQPAVPIQMAPSARLPPRASSGGRQFAGPKTSEHRGDPN